MSYCQDHHFSLLKLGEKAQASSIIIKTNCFSRRRGCTEEQPGPCGRVGDRNQHFNLLKWMRRSGKTSPPISCASNGKGLDAMCHSHRALLRCSRVYTQHTHKYIGNALFSALHWTHSSLYSHQKRWKNHVQAVNHISPLQLNTLKF